MNASFQQTLIFFLAVSPEKSNQISLDHENLGIYSQLDGKSKIWFLTFLNVYVSCIERDRFWSHSFNLQNLCILQTRMDQSGEGGGPWCQQKTLGYSNLGICNWKFSSHYDSEFLLTLLFFDILIHNISWAVAQTPIKHAIF